MLATALFTAPAAHVLRPALNLLLTHAGVAASQLTDASDFSVRLTQAAPAFNGLGPVLALLTNAGGAVYGETPVARSAVSQWMHVGSLLSTGALSPLEVEPLMSEALAASKTSFLLGTPAPTAGDVFVFAALQAHGALPASQRTLHTFLKAAGAHAMIAPLKAAADAGAASPNADAAVAAPAGGAKGSAFDKPTPEEIERRRVEKEKAKAAKAAAAAAAGAAAPAAAAAAGGKKGGAAPAAAAAPLGPNEELELRVGLIVEVAPHPTADRLYVEKIDLGEESGPRTIVSGLREHYAVEQLQGATVVVVANMKEKALQGVGSKGMVLCASDAVAGVKLIAPPAGSAPGTRVFIGEASAAPAPALKVPSTSRMMDLLGGLRSNEAGAVMWKDSPLVTVAGAVTAPIPNVLVK
jgi:methionine--tRNA ligase beta chain